MIDATFDDGAPAASGSGLFGLGTKPRNARVHVLPVPVEGTTSYRGGASRAPRAILEASHQVDLEDPDCGDFWRVGIALLPQRRALRDLDERVSRAVQQIRRAKEPDTPAVRRARERAAVAGASINAAVAASARKSLEAGHLVGVLGGDHSAPFGLIETLAARHPGLGVLHIDAHHDLREAYEGLTWSHASIMHQVARLEEVERIVQVGVRDYCSEEARRVAESERRIICHYDHEMTQARFDGVSWTQVVDAIIKDLPDAVHVSLDVDGLDPGLCPNTGTPVPGGLGFNELVHLLRRLVASGRRIVGFDLCEVAPGRDGWDAIVGARLLFKLCGFMLVSQDGAVPTA